VFARALADSAARPPDRPQYNVVLTLTNHFPFTLPPGAPDEITARIRTIVERSGRPVSTDEVARLQTFAYTDHALGVFLAGLDDSGAAAQSIIVAVADHATSDRGIWQQGSEASLGPQQVVASRIPLLIVFPEPLIAGARDPAQVRAAIRRVNELLGAHPSSQNDIPLLVLELLTHYPPMRSIATAWRWHTLGGQVLSPYFRAPHPDAEVLGIDALSRLVWARGDGRLIPTDEVARPTLDPAEVPAVAGSLLPAAAFLAAFLQTHGNTCWQAEHIRARP
jgi:hypothetical protein